MTGYRPFLPGWSVCSVPPPNGCVRLLDPSERLVIEPDPKGCVWPVTLRPERSVSVESVPAPKGCVRVVVPSDQRVIVPAPNFWVCPVIVRPSRLRSVVSEPEPKGRVWLLVPSERLVIVPEPNFCVVPVRGPVIPARGGAGSAAAAGQHIPQARQSVRLARDARDWIIVSGLPRRRRNFRLATDSGEV